MLKKDNFKFGLLLGFLAPILSLVIYYFWKFRLFSVKDFFHFIASNTNQITAISVPCLVLNIALLTYCFNSRLDKTAKGVFAVTLVYAVAAVLFKFVL
ncbi:MAG TPA: hypothetical protein VKT28_00960 [Puia sp.]|nr:hypothetical protein [Puia sp.]